MREIRHFRVHFTIFVIEKFEDLMNRGVVSACIRLVGLLRRKISCSWTLKCSVIPTVTMQILNFLRFKKRDRYDYIKKKQYISMIMSNANRFTSS